MRPSCILFLTLALLLPAGTASGRVDLVTLPKRDTVQLTIYNSADLTLARETRALTLQKGTNRLQFSWANTLIDPTSLEMFPRREAGSIDILELLFPARTQRLGLWRIDSRISGDVPVEISYLTSGLSWRSFYRCLMSSDEKTMRLEGYVRVTNNSGEDYENASVRMIVGKIHVLDSIADLARRQYPYGRPGPGVLPVPSYGAADEEKTLMQRAKHDIMRAERTAMSRPKEITKEGLSEYFLYTIEGTETIPNGWSKRLPSFTADHVPVENLYKYDEERYAGKVIRFLSFKNDRKHKLGSTPIPGGILKAYRFVGDAGNLSYQGQSQFKYIPVNEDVELNLGAVSDVIVEPTLIDYRTDNYLFDSNNDISGWDEIRKFSVNVKNTRDIAVRVQIRRNINTYSWNLDHEGSSGSYEKIDLDTVQFTLSLESGEKKSFTYVLTTRHGERAEK